MPEQAVDHLLGPIQRQAIEEVRGAGYVMDCEQCGTNLYLQPPAPLGTFMLVDQVWNVVSLDGQIKCLCLTCTEEVLGTPLPSWTFRTSEMVPAYMLTKALQDRLNPATDVDFNLSVTVERVTIARREFPRAFEEMDTEDG